jgi:hypothetical protein
LLDLNIKSHQESKANNKHKRIPTNWIFYLSSYFVNLSFLENYVSVWAIHLNSTENLNVLLISLIITVVMNTNLILDIFCVVSVSSTCSTEIQFWDVLRFWRIVLRKWLTPSSIISDSLGFGIKQFHECPSSLCYEKLTFTFCSRKQ